MSTLHERIRAVVEERLRIARAALWPGNPEYGYYTEDEATALHHEANDPADAILGAEHALGILDEHKLRELYPFGGLCEGCSVTEGSDILTFVEYPCRSILALATRWRVEVDG